MERGYSVETEIPSAYAPDFPSFLFHDQRHLDLQGEKSLTYFLVRKSKQKIMARISFHIEKNSAVSPARAPFGSLSFSEDLPTENLYNFIEECENRLRKLQVRSVLIKEPPLFYQPSREKFQAMLINQRYQVINAEIGAGIPVDEYPFISRVQTWEKRKIRQAKEKGLIVKKLPSEDLRSVYDFILKCRLQRGWSLSMSFEELQRVVNIFPESFFLFGTFLKKEMTSASISIKVSPDVLYNFYSGHLKKFDSLSPIVLLIGDMYKFCSGNNIKWLDLGTSAIDGKPNFNLLDFKFRLGAKPSLKLTFEKQL